jgi:hypothetical protein
VFPSPRTVDLNMTVEVFIGKPIVDHWNGWSTANSQDGFESQVLRGRLYPFLASERLVPRYAATSGLQFPLRLRLIYQVCPSTRLSQRPLAQPPPILGVGRTWLIVTRPPRSATWRRRLA